MKCHANTGPVEKTTPVLFEQSSEQSWPGGLEISEELRTIPYGSLCRVQINVSNTSNHDITLNKRTVLGTLQLVKSVTLQEVHRKDIDSEPQNGTMPTKQEDAQTSNFAENKDRDYDPIDDLDLSGLTTQQQIRVREMLAEEKGVFSKSDDGVGCIEELELKLNIKDQTPVQKTYNSIPRHLYPLR